MPKQPDLFDLMERSIPVVDPHVDPRDKPRLGNNSAAILKRLQQGPASNIQLMEIGGIRFGARVHDLKKVGYEIRSERMNDGVWIYELVEGSK